MLANEAYTHYTVPYEQGNNMFDKDFTLTFQTGGNKLIQSFSSTDVALFLYDSNHKLLKYDDGSGYKDNSLFTYNFEANKTYILGVSTLFYNYAKDVAAIGIAPVRESYSSFEGMDYMNSNEQTYFMNYLNSVRVMRVKSSVNGKHPFVAYDRSDLHSGTRLYVIEPWSAKCVEASDGTSQARATVALTAYRDYFVVVAPSDITTFSGNMSLLVEKPR